MEKGPRALFFYVQVAKALRAEPAALGLYLMMPESPTDRVCALSTSPTTGSVTTASLADQVLAVNDDLPPIRTDKPVHSGKVRSVCWLTPADSARLIWEKAMMWPIRPWPSW